MQFVSSIQLNHRISCYYFGLLAELLFCLQHTHTQKQCLRFWNLTIFLVILFWLEIETINWVIMDNTRKHHCQLKKLLFYSEAFAPISSVNRKKSYFLHSTSINSPFFLPFVRRFFFSVIHTVFDLKNGSKYPDIWQNEVTS